MTRGDFEFLCDLHNADRLAVANDEFVKKILAKDKIKNTTFNQITLSTYIQMEHENTKK